MGSNPIIGTLAEAVAEAGECEDSPDFNYPLLAKGNQNVNMKMRSLLLTLAVVPCLTGAGADQKAGTISEASKYDAVLAKQLGADDYGMKNYVFVILKTGPSDANYKGKERDDIFAAHLANIGRLANEGKLAVAGPFGKNDKGFRGLFIFNVSTVAEAQTLVETDPAIKAGILIADMTPWYGSASLMATPEIHKKIARANP